ncbi:ATP-grasp domain-containing protein [Kitasatospora cystarginea]|uniref:ATP-grasp domain-containing protein n=1 Tax=Kitasatospora cystarginea TaxID=58350 RepID=UPI0031DBF7ED
MITSYDEAIRRLTVRPGLALAARPFLLLPLLRAGCLSHVLSVEAADQAWEGQFDAEFHSLEKLTRVRDNTVTSAGIDDLVRRLPGSDGGTWRGRELGLISYLALKPRWQSALEDLGARLVLPYSPPAVSVLSDKIAQREWFRSIGARTPLDTVVGDLDHLVLRRRFGHSYVVQTPRGSNGRGTHLVTGAEDLGRIAPTGPWLVSQYTEGVPVNIHGLVSADDAVSVLRASVQLTRTDGIGAPFGAYSGCDFEAPALLPPLALSRARDVVERIGRQLAGLGYRGLFGADFVLCGDQPLLLEANCRMQGSTWLLGELELAENALPSSLRHVLERYGLTTRADPGLDPAGGCQLVIRHTGAPARVLAAPTGGVHRLKDGLLHRCGDGFGLLECGTDDCVLLQLPSAGTVLHPGAPLARLVARYSLTTPDGSTLRPHGRQLVDALHAQFTLEPC